MSIRRRLSGRVSCGLESIVRVKDSKAFVWYRPKGLDCIELGSQMLDKLASYLQREGVRAPYR
jgi:hypothetical protein